MLTGDLIKRLSDGVLLARKKTLGCLTDDLSRPLIAICNSYSEINLAHLNFTFLAKKIREGVLLGGGIPIEFGMIAACDAIAHGRPHQKYILPAREVMADSIEVFLNAHGIFDALVCLGACDKVIPATLMAAMRANIPTIIVTGGPQFASLNTETNADVCSRIATKRAKEAAPVEAGFPRERLFDERDIKTLYLDGKITDAEFTDLYYSTVSNVGVCRPYATAGTMLCVTEALGMCLSGSALIPQLSVEKGRQATLAGQTIMKLVRHNIRPKDIVTHASIENALRCLMAIGGAQNAILHLLAIANTAGIPFDYADVDRISRSTPFLIDLKRNFGRDISGFREAGGVIGVLRRIRGLIHEEVMTVDGVKLGTLIDETGQIGDVIKTVDNPISQHGGVLVMKGNLAQRGALLNIANVPEDKLRQRYVRKAITFNSQEEFCSYIITKKPDHEAVIIVRYEGPVGGPGMRESHRISEIINHFNLLHEDFILVTDGRFSGASQGFIIGYVAPEAANEQSLLGLIKDGDVVEICMQKREVNLLVGESEIAQRRLQHLPKLQEIPEHYQYLKKYRKLVQGAEVGAVLKLS